MSARTNRKFASLIGTLGGIASATFGQPGSLAFETVTYGLSSAKHAHSGAGEQPETAFAHTITMPKLSLKRKEMETWP